MREAENKFIKIIDIYLGFIYLLLLLIFFEKGAAAHHGIWVRPRQVTTKKIESSIPMLLDAKGAQLCAGENVGWIMGEVVAESQGLDHEIPRLKLNDLEI